MKRKVFVNSDIILDLLARRELFYGDSAKLFALACEKKVELFTSAVVLANVFYIVSKIIGTEDAKRQIKGLRLLLRILPVSETVTDLALNSKFADFEDAIQYYTAKEHKIFVLLTRNTGVFKPKDRVMVVQAPGEWVNWTF